MQSKIEKWMVQLEKKYGERRKDEFAEESPTVAKYLEALSGAVASTYELDKPLAVGGTGVVFTGHHIRFKQAVVVKFNRPNVATNDVSMVENESRVLPVLSHPNIIRVLDLGQLGGKPTQPTAPTPPQPASKTPRAAGKTPKLVVQVPTLDEKAPLLDAKTPKLTYLVEPFISGSKPFFTIEKDRVEETWLHQRLQTLKASLPDATNRLSKDTGTTSELTNAVLSEIASLFAQWISLLNHLHATHTLAKQGYVYLDVKPENVLIDRHGHLTSIDYGSVEPIDRDDASPLQVFFTERYAHPMLDQKQVEKASANRVRGSLKRSDLSITFDYYALGMSFLEILNEVATVRPTAVPQLPLYRALHFLATRLLDRHNSRRGNDDLYEYASQVFPSLNEGDYANLSYSSLDDAYRDIEKERGRWNLEERVPELATYSKDIVRLVPGFNTVLTPRLRGVIEHPLVARLKYVTQLGLVSLIYPTADHARYDHALGSYTYTTNYVKSLFNDLGNPLFRNLVGVEDLNAVLLAALLHDLGQYPLAHDLEEVHERVFKHGSIGVALLADSMVDRHGRTLLQIIEDPENGWGVSQNALSDILGAHSKNTDGSSDTLDEEAARRSRPLKTDVLSAIVDGPVDADKADYIIRDSARCELPYGNQLDMERLLRVLTVAVIPEDAAPGRRVTLGVYDKGLASAHAFGQARYQLLATVYWHHTSRIAKAMLQYSAALGLPREVFGPLSETRERKEVEIRERLLAFLRSLVPPFDVAIASLSQSHSAKEVLIDLEEPPPSDVLQVLIAEAAVPDTGSETPRWYPGIAWTDWLMLEWIAKLPDATEVSRGLIDCIQTRQLYKRIATFQRGGPHDNIIEALDGLPWPDRVDVCRTLHERIYRRLRRDWQNIPTAAGRKLTDFDLLAQSSLLILIDIPQPSKKIGSGSI